MKLTNSVEIQASPDKVFCWIEDPKMAKKWMTSVTKSQIINETPKRVGTTFTEYVEENGKGIQLKGIITEFQRNKKFAVHLESDYTSTDVTFVLNPVGNHTQLIQNIDLRFKGLARLISLLSGSQIKKKILIQSQAEFLALKKFCEIN